MPAPVDNRERIRQRLEAARERRPATASPPSVDPVPRINELIRAARTTWLGLLSYLAFIGVTLLGVEDADFFITERQTELPLVGVSVPTALFFAIAPTLGVMLYTYMHLYLLKLWEELAKAPADVKDDKLGDEIDPWLVADYALTFRPDSPVRQRPLSRLVNTVSLTLIFFATPLLLGWFWWRSMPKHDEVLTLLWCGVPLVISLGVSTASWRRLRRLASNLPDGPIRRVQGRAVWIAVWLVVALFGWMRTEGTLIGFAWANGLFVADAAKAGNTDLRWFQTPFPGLLAPTELSAEVFVDTPPDWLVKEEAEKAFRGNWCRTEGLSPEICGKGPFTRADSGPFQHHHRQTWCTKTFPSDITHLAKECDDHFERMEKSYRAAWVTARDTALSNLPRRDLSGADLRGADLTGAQLEGADLSGARLEWANLAQARLEGANLRSAHLEGANLSGARLEGAILLRAHLDGVALLSARLDDQTFLAGAEFHGAAVRVADLSLVPISQDQLNEMFGDASVLLPDGLTRPLHWSSKTLSFFTEFTISWHEWQERVGYTAPGPKRSPIWPQSLTIP